MMGRWSLSMKILCLGFLNLLLLCLVMLIFLRVQFRLGPESILLGPARDRIAGIANSFAIELESTPPESRAELFAAYRERYNADFFLISPQGHSLAGPDVHLPPEVLERIRGNRPRRPPPPRHDPPPGEERGPGRRPPPPRQPPPESTVLVITRAPASYWAGVFIPITAPDGERNVPAILLLRTDSIFNSHLFFDLRLWLGVVLSVIAVSVLCWLPFIHGLTRSIARMDRATEQIEQGRFDVQAADDRQDELGHLAMRINRMAARLESFVNNQKRFLGDIAHELCAPIARIQFALGILEQKVEAAQQPNVAVLHEEIQEMSSLVNELLSFSKAAMLAGEMQLVDVGVANVARRVVSREAVNVNSVQISIDPELSVVAHEGYLLRSLANIVRNAIRYSGDDGPITITALRDEKYVSITVADCGPGLPEEALEEVFAPFYRPESSRSRDTGGVGLGLAIVKSCIEACRGTVACRNRKPTGLEVCIRLRASDTLMGTAGLPGASS